MKYKVYLLFLLCLMLLTACSSQKTNQDDHTSSIDSEQGIEEEWAYYANGRFNYTIKYPASWVAGEESQNGDGKILYIGNPDVDIRVYGSYDLEGISDNYHDEDAIRQDTKLENGNDAVLLLGKKDGKVKYDMVYVSSEDIEYHFYAEVTEQFFADNEKILLEVARSLNTPE